MTQTSPTQALHLMWVLRVLWVMALGFTLSQEPAQAHTPGQTLASECTKYLETARDPLVSELSSDPVATYRALTEAAERAKRDQVATFVFEQGRYTLQKIYRDILSRKSTEPELASLEASVQGLLNGRIFYLPYWRTVLEYVRACDRIVRRQHPELTSRYNEELAAHLFESFLERAPHAFLFATFDEVDMHYFLRSKAVPVYLIGLTTEPAYADGYLLSPLEFFMHDLGHSDYMASRDLKLLLNGEVSPLQRTRDWARVADRILSKHEQLTDPDLKDAIHQLLFEILHERGFSYDPRSLRRETETEKWTDVVRRKYQSVFFRGAKNLNTRLFDRLTEARLWIERQTRMILEDDVLNQVRESKAVSFYARITHDLPSEYHLGDFLSVDINPGEKAPELEAHFKTSQGILSTELYYNVSLAQVDALPLSPLTPERVAAIERALSAGHSVRISADGLTQVTTPLARPLGLAEPSGSNKLDSLVVFKINQLLGLASRKTQATFSLDARERPFIGRITSLSGRPGARILEVLERTDDGAGKRFTLPMSEVRIHRLVD